MSDWPTSRKNDAPRGGEGETGLEAMVSAPRPSDCPRSAPALRGRFFAWEEKGKRARGVDVERRRAITESGQIAKRPPGSARRAPPRRFNAGFEGFSLNIEPAQTTSRERAFALLQCAPFFVGETHWMPWDPKTPCNHGTGPDRKPPRRDSSKSATAPPQCRLRGLFVEFGSSGQRDADRRGRQRFFAAVLLRLAVDALHGPGVCLGSRLRANSHEAASPAEAAGSRDACGMLAPRRDRMRIRSRRLVAHKQRNGLGVACVGEHVHRPRADAAIAQT